MAHLNAKSLAALLVTYAIMAALLFVPAGTLDYWQAWAYLIVFVVSGTAITVYLMRNDPKLLERRVRGGPTAEKAAGQRIAMSVASLAFIAILIVSAFDRREHWSNVRAALAIAGDASILIGMTCTWLVFRANPYASATIELADDQRVISDGPYGLVRHPMYAGALLYLIGMPIALGSWWAFIAVALMLPPFVWRLLDEERMLSKSLPGYSEYCATVRYRVLPGIW